MTKRLLDSILGFTLFFTLAGIAVAQDETDKQPDATFELTEGDVGAGIGWSWGGGTRTYEGQEYKFKVEGLSVGDVGVSEASAIGQVYNLEQLEDFNGHYAGVAAAGAVDKGAGTARINNNNGVVIVLFSDTKGVDLALAMEGVTFTLKNNRVKNIPSVRLEYETNDG